MRALTLYYGLLVSGLMLMFLPGLGVITLVIYFVAMPIGAAYLWRSQGYSLRHASVHHHPALVTHITGGMVSGLAAVGLIFGLLHAVGWVRIESAEWTLAYIILWLVIQQSLVALLEEFTFRGVIQQFLVSRWGQRYGLIGAASLFGLFHTPNILYQDVPATLIPFTIVNLGLMGLVFGWAFRQTGDHLALPVALHLGWNIAAYGLQGNMAIEHNAPALLVGSSNWFPESGLAGTVGLLVLMGPIWLITTTIENQPREPETISSAS